MEWEPSQKRNEDPKKLIGQRAYISFQQRTINCGDGTKQRKRGFGLRALNCEKVTRKNARELMKDGGYFSKSVCTDSSHLQ